MNKRKIYCLHISILISFIVLNILSTYFQTTLFLNRYISPVRRTFQGELTAIMGNFSFLLFIVIITYLIFKKDKNRFKTLMIVSLILNLFIFGSNIYTKYYSTTFTIHSLDLLKNPAEGVSDGLFLESILELFTYYRILIFIPFITILTLYIIYAKETNGTIIKTNIRYVQILISLLSFLLLFVLSTSMYLISLSKNSFNINAISSTNGVQNYGIYPYYVGEFLGVKFDFTTRKSLKVEDDKSLYDSFDEYNKNKDEYKNFIDSNIYSKNLLLKDSVIKENELLNLNGNDSLNGIFKNKNLMLIHLESLNYFLFDIPEIRENFTFLNKLLEESFVFDNYYTNVGMGVTSDAELSVLTGIYPNGYSTFYWDYEKGNYNFQSLPKLLNERNYFTKAYHADHPIFYNREKAYKDLIGFNKPYYSIKDFANSDGYNNISDYLKYRSKGVLYNDLLIKSPWPSEFELMDVVYNDISNINNNYMTYPLFLTQHTPFLFNPYDDFEINELKNYAKLKPLTKRYINYSKYIDDLIKSVLFNPINNESRIDDNTVYIFYSDHGSQINNGDLSLLYDEDLSVLNERLLLQKTIAFIYAPSNKINSETNLNKGLIKGSQQRVRSHIDLYRTIVDLYDLNDNVDYYFGVNGLSKEPSFVIDGRVQDLIIDNINNYNTPFITSLRNYNLLYPKESFNNQTYIMSKIVRFKKLNDLYLIDDSVHKQLNILYKNN